MNSLRELQASCHRAFTGTDPTALEDLVHDKGIPPQQRIAVYRNNHREIYRKALSASYPVVERLAGEDCLAGLAHQYSRQHPSRCGDMQRFGARFAAFLERTYGNSQFRYLSDVAELEWALEEVHLEPDEPRLHIKQLQKFADGDYGNLVFEVCRAVRLLSSRFPVLAIWRANQPGSDARVDLNQGGQHVAVVRRGNDLQMHLLEANTFALVSELARGTRLADAWQPRTTETGESDAGAAQDLAGALQTILSLGLVAGVSPAGPPSTLP